MPATRFDRFRDRRKPGDALGALVLGTAAIKSLPQYKLAAIGDMTSSSFSNKVNHNKDFGSLTLNQVLAMCAELGITREQFAAQLPLRKEFVE